MNIQIYVSKKNFDMQKAERFFKERRIPYQLVDVKRHPPGNRELALFARQIGAKELVDREDKKAKEHTVCYMDSEAMILEELAQNPQFLRSPLVRNGNQVTVGLQEDTWAAWLKQEE